MDGQAGFLWAGSQHLLGNFGRFSVDPLTLWAPLWAFVSTESQWHWLVQNRPGPLCPVTSPPCRRCTLECSPKYLEEPEDLF